MNYAILAESAARDIARTNPEVSISEATSTIAAALRRTANEAAWDGYNKGRKHQRTRSIGLERQIAIEMYATYGPRPEGGTR